MRNRTVLYLIIANILFATYYIVILLSVDVSYFYKNIGGALNYYVMAKSLAETGSTEVSIAEGEPTITCSKIPAYVRFPIFMLFKDTDSRIRAIQLFNLVLLMIVANLFWVYLHITMPANWNKLFTLIPFFYLIFNPWFANVTTPQVESIYAIQCFLVVLIVKTTNGIERLSKRSLPVLIALTFLLWTGIMLKFTIVSLLVFIIIYFFQNRKHSLERYEPKKSPVIIVSLVVIVLIALVVNYNLIIYYIKAIYDNNMKYHSLNIIALRSVSNLLFSAIPAQIIPQYDFIFDNAHKPIGCLELDQFTIKYIFWLISGLSISVITGIGLWQLRRQMAPEIGCLLTLLIYMMTPISVARHLSLVQPFLWIFFLQGLVEIIDALRRRSQLLVPGLFTLIIFITITVELHYIHKISEYTINRVGPKELYSHIGKIATIYRNGRNYIESLPRKHTRFVLCPNKQALWNALLDIKYITPESINEKLRQGFDIYVVMECTHRNCYETTIMTQSFLEKLGQSEKLNNHIVFTQENDAAKIIIYKIN